MRTAKTFFQRNPMEICLLFICGILFVYLLNVSTQVQTRQEQVIHQFLTFAGYAVRTSFEATPIVSPDEIMWEVEAPYLVEGMRLETIIATSEKQLEQGIYVDGERVPLGQNQRQFVEDRREDAIMKAVVLETKRMIAMHQAEIARDARLEEMVQERYHSLLRSINALFELEGPFFFIYFPETTELYTDRNPERAVKLNTIAHLHEMLKTSNKSTFEAFIALISIDDGVQLGCYMPTNYTNEPIVTIIQESLPFIIITVILTVVACCLLSGRLIREYNKKELGLRIKRLTNKTLYANQEDNNSGERKRYQDFDSAAFLSNDNFMEESEAKRTSPAPLSIMTDDSRPVLYGALWVANFLSLETTPIRVQLDRFTNVPTRITFAQLLRELWIKITYLHAPIFLAHIDVDNLERANRLLGYTSGNSIIEHMVATVQRNLNKSGIMGRLSSDNFVCLYVGTREEFEAVIKNILHEINSMPFEGSKVHTPSVSVGFTQLTEADLSPEEGQRRALAALYQAKSAGKNCYRFV